MGFPLVLKLRHLGASVVEVRPILSATKLAPKSALNDFWCYYQMLLRTRTELCGPRVCVCVSWVFPRKPTPVRRLVFAVCCWTSVSRSLRRTRWRNWTSLRDRNSLMKPHRSVCGWYSSAMCVVCQSVY